MKAGFVLVGLVIFLQLEMNAQQPLKAKDQFVHLSGGIGSSQGQVALSYNYNWGLGKKRRIEIGLGARFTSYFGSNQYYRTAPAKLTSGKTGPGVIFSEDIDENIDTVFFNKPQINALNLALNLGYRIGSKFTVGANIDLAGFSFGAEKTGTYYDGNNLVPPSAMPTGFNLLLTSDNDRGTLNSEFFVKYKINPKWSVDLAYGFLFTEYTTSTDIQTTPDGQKNDRFRNKTSTFNAGLSWHF